MATTAATMLETVSDRAKTANRRSRMMAALATDRLPDTSRIGVRAHRIGAMRGSDNSWPAGQAARASTPTRTTQISSDSQKMVDCSALDGSAFLTRALPRPASVIMLANRMNGMAKATRP